MRNFSENEARILIKAFWNLVNLTNISIENVSFILTAPLSTEEFEKYKVSSNIPKSVNRNQMLTNILEVVTIYVRLKQMYPHNPSIVKNWFNTPTNEFNGNTPLDTINSSGANEGLKMIREIVELKLYF